MSDAQPFSIDDARPWVTPPGEDTDKYGRGVLGVVTGSTAYPGAAVIGVDAALHTGLGMVRYVGPPRAGDLVLARRPEVVQGIGRVQAWLVGSGTNPDQLDDTTREGFDRAREDGTPVIVDAGALGVVRTEARGILTPHAGELAKLLGIGRDAVAADPLSAALRAAEQTGSTVLLKGRNTFVVDPGGAHRFVCSSATPWLATAGAGDALGGVLGALVAARAAVGSLVPADLAHLAAAAAVIHGTAAVRASQGGPFTITALAEQIPTVIRALVERNRGV
ncbi:ADP-dependent NAD(P)H-hydrate dehydratase [Curtobacterium ammoniigenes]|uniref:ADP-dependent NAD(P)H-hydrate dehydratase n=1 Tax=Curtobacterium ammoniigenes TaxID=395387 RepID=UPI0009FA859D|nr:ADP/ATP-dependent (S)-NAD(P)H-hydrate dehydratase [Curtobacterium ammoniigenes]